MLPPCTCCSVAHPWLGRLPSLKDLFRVVSMGRMSRPCSDSSYGAPSVLLVEPSQCAFTTPLVWSAVREWLPDWLLDAEAQPVAEGAVVQASCLLSDTSILINDRDVEQAEYDE